jgi:hypothetical protein
MPFTNSGKNAMLDHMASIATHISAHTGAPGESGTSEVTGGSYARQTNTWNAASAGNLDNSNTPAIPIPAATTVTHLGFWSALSAGTFYGWYELPAAEAFGSAGTLNVTDADLSITG